MTRTVRRARGGPSLRTRSYRLFTYSVCDGPAAGASSTSMIRQARATSLLRAASVMMPVATDAARGLSTDVEVAPPANLRSARNSLLTRRKGSARCCEMAACTTLY